MRQFWPLLDLWNFALVSNPVCEENMEMSYFDPSYLPKFGKMYSFYPPLDPL